MKSLILGININFFSWEGPQWGAQVYAWPVFESHHCYTIQSCLRLGRRSHTTKTTHHCYWCFGWMLQSKRCSRRVGDYPPIFCNHTAKVLHYQPSRTTNSIIFRTSKYSKSRKTLWADIAIHAREEFAIIAERRTAGTPISGWPPEDRLNNSCSSFEPTVHLRCVCM